MKLYDLCRQLFRRAEAVGKENKLPDPIPSAEMQEAARLKIDDTKRFQSHLLLGSGDLFCAKRVEILDLLARQLSFEDNAAWRWQRPAFDDQLGQFFGNAESRSYPALVWTMPVYISTKYGLKLWGVKPRDYMLDDLPLGIAGHHVRKVRMGFSVAEDEPAQQLNLDRMLFMYRQEEAPRVPIAWMRRELAGVLRNGRPLVSAFEENLGLATPDDYDWQKQGCFPAHDGLVVKDEQGTRKYINQRVLILARLLPNASELSARVQQVVVAFHPRTAMTVDFNTVQRSFGMFARNYLGLAALLKKATRMEA